jgi:antitoxin MazE
MRFAKWGNSLALRIPAAYAKAVGACENSPAQLKIENGALVVTPIKPTEEVPYYDLDALLAQITDENRHDEVETGSPVGAEFGASPDEVG